MIDNDPAKKPTERVAIVSSAFFFFGLAGLIYMDFLWPGILPLIFLIAVPIVIAEEGWRMGLWILTQTAIWLTGLAFLIRYDLIWPGVLVLAGMSALVVAIAPPDRVEAARRRARANRAVKKAKRGLPLPLDRLEEEPFIMEDDESRAQQMEHR